MAQTYVDWVNQFVPGWLQRTWGKRFLRVPAFTFDVLRDAAKDAVKLRFPATATDDSIGWVGHARNTERFRVESDASYRGAVDAAWDEWFRAGTAACLIDKLTRAGYVPGGGSVVVYPWYQAVGFTPAPPAYWANWWSAFWIAINPSPFTKKFWGSPPAWGAIVPSPIGNPPAVATWGSNANAYDVAQMRRIVRRWKPANQVCAAVVFRATAGTDLFDSNNISIGCRTYEDTSFPLPSRPA